MFWILLFWFLILGLSIWFLVKGSEYFINASETIGYHFKISPFIVGVTIVALGTSLPELVSSIVAVMTGHGEIVAGNVIGSNITNIFLILGVGAIIGKNLKVSHELIHVDLPLFIGSTLIFALCIWDGVFTWLEGVVCLLGVAIYLAYTFWSERTPDSEIKRELKSELLEKNSIEWKTIAILFISAGFIYLGARFTVEAVLHIATLFQTGADVVAITAVALGTSLPELTVTIAAARMGKAEVAVGNILGSSIFNSLAVMGVPSLFGNISISSAMLNFGLPVMLVASGMYFIITQDKQITQWEGYFLLLFYVLFLGKIFGFI